MLKIDILFDLSIKDCMFITFKTENFEGCYNVKFDSNLIGILVGLRKLDYWCLVGHPNHSSLLALHLNLNPNGFPYPMPNPPTQPCCIPHQQFPLCQLHIFFSRHFFTSKIQRGNEMYQFIVFFNHSQFLTFIVYGKLALRPIGIIMESSNCLVWFGYSSISTLDNIT